MTSLHPDLELYLQDHYQIGLMLRHPLVFCIPYADSSEMNEILNKQYLTKKEEVERCLKEGLVSRAIWFYERPYRMEKLLDHADEITDDGDFWQLLGSIYTDSENIHQVQKALTFMLNCGRPGRERMMDEREQEYLAHFPEELVVYRGHQGINKYGYSWTLSHIKASWFSRRFEAKCQEVSWGRVKKRDIIGFFSRRGEMDILVNPKKVRAVVKFKLPVAPRPNNLQRIMEITTSAFRLPTRQSVHGPDHWAKVEFNGMAICDETPLADRLLVRAFALIHDCCRENEHTDPEHGHRAAKFMLGNQEIMELLGVGGNSLARLVFALQYHNDGQVSDDPTIGACWDADRLDLPRVGYVPNPARFSTKRGKELIFNI